MTVKSKKSLKKWLTNTLLMILAAACVYSSATNACYAAGDSFEIETITWKIKGTTLLGAMNYHIREVVAINGIDVNSTSDMDSSYAFCVEPTIVGPENHTVDVGGTYTAGPKSKGGGGEHIYTFNGDEAAEEGYKMMRKLCYYLPSGYGWKKTTYKWWKEYKDGLGSNTDEHDLRSVYSLGATVLSKRWGKDADDPEGSANYGYNRLDDKGKALVDKFLTEVKDLPNPPADYIAFYVQKDNAQDIWGSLYATEYGSVKVKKSSARKKITDDNKCYDLKGAEFTIYNDKNCTDRAKFKNGDAAILKTKSDGTSDEETIETGDYYIRETKAPEGYALDTTVTAITIERGTTHTYSHKDEPITDLVDLLLTKKPKDYPHDGGEGDASIKGAVYEFRYYDGQYDTAAKAEASGDTTATWNLVTDANGKISGSDPTTASGYTSSAFYKDKDGNITYPLGTYVIREVKAPAGYKINNEKIVVHITEDGTDNLYVNTYNESTTSEEEIVSGGVKLSKIDSESDETVPQGDATLKGAEFTIYNQSAKSVMVGGKEIAKGDAALVITTNESGIAESDAHALPYGTYSVKETKPSKGYKLNTSWSKTFTIREDGVIVDLTESPAKEDIIKGGLKVVKVDADTGKSTPQGDAAIDGAELEIINNSTKAVFVKGAKYSKGQRVMTIKVSGGVAATGARDLPYGKYIVREIATNNGYLLNSGWQGEVMIDEDGVIKDVTPAKLPNTVKRGGVRIPKIDSDLKEAYAQGDATLKGAEFTIYNQSAQSVVVNGKEVAKGGAALVITTDDGGIAVSDAHALPYGTYSVKETKPSKGYLLNTKWSVTFSIREDGVIVDLEGSPVIEEVERGGLRVTKVDADTGRTTPQGDAIIDGAEFEIINNSAHDVVVKGERYPKGQRVMTIKAVKGVATTGNRDLPYGHYIVKEIAVNNGYHLNKDWQGEVFIDQDGVIKDVEPARIPNHVKRFGLKIQKIDNDLDEAYQQGDSTLEGAEFTIWNKSAQGVVTRDVPYLSDRTPAVGWANSNGSMPKNAKEIARDAVVGIIRTDAKGASSTLSSDLSYGTYFIKETKPSKGYNLNEKWSFTVKVYTEEGKDFVKIEGTNNEEAVSETLEFTNGMIVDLARYMTREAIIRGGVQIIKRDKEIEKSEKLGGASLEDIVFTIKNVSGKDVVVRKDIGNTNDTVDWKKLSSKQDLFESGAVKRVKVGEDVGKIVTHWNPDKKAYTAETLIDDLPYGTYTIRESKTNDSYQRTDKTEHRFEIREEGVMVSFDDGKNDTVLTFDDYVYRSDVQGTKIADSTSERFSYVPFKIISVSNGETHVVVTDANGFFSTKDRRASGDLDEDEDADTARKQNPFDDLLEAEDIKTADLEARKDDILHGVWFGTGEFGTKAEMKSEWGALPYDSYILEEMPCEHNKGYILQKFWFTVDQKTQTGFVDLETITDDVPEIGTTADVNGENTEIIPAKKIKLTDTIEYMNLKKGEKYTAKGRLIDKKTGDVCKDAAGNEIRAEKEFTARSSNGKVKVEFIFDGSLLYGKDTVVFEQVFDSEGHVTAVHEDIEDEGQTITWEKPDPKYEMYKIRTIKAPSKDDKFGFFVKDEVEYEVHVENTGNIALTMDVTDQFTQDPEFFTEPKLKDVEFDGEGTWNNKDKDEYVANITLERGSKATVSYTAVVKNSAKEYLASAAEDSDSRDDKGNDTNKAYQKNVTDDKDGYWNTAECDNVTYPNPDNSDEPGTLEPKDDVAQTPVQTPEIGTTATVDGRNSDVHPEKEITLTDVIEYKSLRKGETYTAKGRLMDKTTGEVCKDALGKEITSEQKFTAGSSNGKIAVTFTFDGSLLYGKKTVVFEQLLDAEGNVVAVHEDIEDKAQTVTWEYMRPAYEMYKIRTTKAPSKGDKYGFFAQDEVEYEIHVENTGNIALTMDVSDQFTQDPEFFTVPKLKDIKFSGKGTWNNKGKDEFIANITLEPSEKAVITYTAVVNDNAKEYLAAKAKDSDSLDEKGNDINREYQKNETDDHDGYRNTAYCDNVTYPNPENPDEPDTIEPKDDTAQTPVQKPEIGTTLTGNKKAKEVDPCEETILTDSVEYTGLDPSKWYMLEGTLMVKDTGDPLIEDGYEVTVWSEPFQPKKNSGKAEVMFMIDTTDLKGKELVAFETAYRLNDYKKGDDLEKITLTQVAEHKDLNDEDQTVMVKDGPVVSPPPKTGDNTLLWVYAILFIGAFGSMSVVVIREYIKRRRQAKEDREMFV